MREVLQAKQTSILPDAARPVAHQLSSGQGVLNMCTGIQHADYLGLLYQTAQQIAN